MKIITWNCNMAFRNKAAAVLAHRPDILIIPECEHPDKLKFKDGVPLPTDICWFGKNPHQGLGVFSYSHYKFTLLDIHNPAIKMVLPILVTGGKEDFMLFAVYANHPEDTDGQYIMQVWKAIQYYDHLFGKSKIIIAGDFNSNTIWDKPRRKVNHTTVVNLLAEKRIYSTYHHFHRQVQGAEAHPTFYLYRHEKRPYHLDYCFASADFIEKLQHVEVGTYQDWKTLSDHKPVIVTFDW